MIKCNKELVGGDRVEKKAWQLSGFSFKKQNTNLKFQVLKDKNNELDSIWIG